MGRYQMSRLLLSVQSTNTSSETITDATATLVPEYSDVLIIFTCLLCALICVVGVMGVVRWTCLKRPLPSTSITNDVEAPAPAPLSECFKKKILESLPKLIFKSADVTVSEAASPGPTLASGEAECVICLSEFVDGEEIRVLPVCTHVFHVGCIDTWLIGSQSFCCPSCRQVLAVNQQCHKCVTGASLSTAQEADYLP